MARDKKLQPNTNNSDPDNYPNARIKDNTGPGDGTGVNEAIYGDMHETFAKIMRLYGIPYNGSPDNETTGYQYVDALRALATKNDFVLNIGVAAGKLTIPIKTGLMLPNEQVICKAVADKAAETVIVGSDNLERVVTFVGDFKAGEYVRLINTSTTVVLIRMVDSVNLDAAVNELSYLKAATLPQELAGVSDEVATTPLNNLLAFVERVNGATSDGALAIAGVRNGLLSKADKTFIDNFASNERNYGSFSPADIDTSTPIGTSVAVSGDIVSALVSSNTNDGEVYNVTFQNPMSDLNYQINLSVESLGALDDDNNLQEFVWKKINLTQFQIIVEQTNSTGQNIKVHIEIKQR